MCLFYRIGSNQFCHKGAGSLDELNELVVASLQPLKAEGASKSRAESEGRARRFEVEDRAAAGEEGGKYDVGLEVGGCSGGETETEISG